MEPIILPRISDQKPLVSVISITYNHEPYIRDCLEGFVMQKTNFPVEFIVHDDASKDHTPDIMREYYEKSPDLFHMIIQRVNHIYRNAPVIPPLLEMAQGKYIALCEGDDYWTDPLKLQKQFDFMEANSGYSCCFHNALLLNASTGAIKKYYRRKIRKDWTLRDVIAGGGGLMPTASMFFRSECIEGYSEFKAGCPVGDYPMGICLAQKGKVRYSDEIMSVYRMMVPGSWSDRNNNYEVAIRSSNRMLEWLSRLEQMISEKDAFSYAKGYFLTRIHELKKEYSEIKKDKLAMYYVNHERTSVKIKYYIKIYFPILVRTKENCIKIAQKRLFKKD